MARSMQIDAARAIDALTRYLAELVEREGIEGLLLGLSGGIDSAILAALAVRAVGAERVACIYLRDRDSDPNIAENARRVAEQPGLALEVVDMSGEMARHGIYRPLITKLLSVSDALTALIRRSYALICRESPFRSSPCVGAMTGLLKTQVRQLAVELGLPEAVRAQPPSPDMAKGLGDEAAIGHLYRDVDTVVEALDRGFDRRGIEALGIDARELDDVRDLMRLSEWKRASPHVAPPVDGGYRSALRATGATAAAAQAASAAEARSPRRAAEPVG